MTPEQLDRLEGLLADAKWRGLSIPGDPAWPMEQDKVAGTRRALEIAAVNALPSLIASLKAAREAVSDQAILIGVMGRALDVADGVISINCGFYTPKEWKAAFRNVAAARQSLEGNPHVG